MLCFANDRPRLTKHYEERPTFNMKSISLFICATVSEHWRICTFSYNTLNVRHSLDGSHSFLRAGLHGTLWVKPCPHTDILKAPPQRWAEPHTHESPVSVCWRRRSLRCVQPLWPVAGHRSGCQSQSISASHCSKPVVSVSWMDWSSCHGNRDKGIVRFFFWEGGLTLHRKFVSESRNDEDMMLFAYCSCLRMRQANIFLAFHGIYRSSWL